MANTWLLRSITAFVAIVLVSVAAWWMSSASVDVPERVATEIEIDEMAGAMHQDAVVISGKLEAFDGVPSKLEGAWPGFRGSERLNIAESGVALLEVWGEEGPERLWQVELGEGHAGPAVRNGRVYLLDYLEHEQRDALRCFSLDDGREIWRRSYEVHVKRNHGMSRTVPATDGRVVVSMGPKCHVMCVDAIDGDFKWGLDLVRDFGATVPLWYTGQCPLIDDDTAILAPAGTNLIMGVSVQDGEILWQTPNPLGWKMSHSSVMPMTLLDKRMYVYCAIGATFGVSAEPEDRGRLLWHTTEWSGSVLSPSPVKAGEDLVFLTAGYGEGCMMLRVTREDDQFSIDKVFRLERSTFGCEQQTPLVYDGHLFGVLPKDAGALRAQFVCMNMDGELQWTSGKTDRFGLGPFLAADDKMLILDDKGTLTMVKADTRSYQKLAQARVIDGRDAWAPMALVSGRLLLRDSTRLICLDLRAKRS